MENVRKLFNNKLHQNTVSGQFFRLTIPKDSAKLGIFLDLGTFVTVVLSYLNYLKLSSQ